MTTTSRENLVTSDDTDAIDEALEEAFSKEEVNEVHQEPEIELPKVKHIIPQYLLKRCSG